MPLSWNEIRDRAQVFVREWRHTENEDAESKSFLNAFFEGFGVQRRKVGSFERRVKKLDGRDGYIDMLEGCPPYALKQLPLVSERVAAVRLARQKSTRAATRKLADFPSLFGEVRQPSGRFMGLPKTSSGRRPFVPFAFFGSEVFASSDVFTIPAASSYHFGILHSTMHDAWVRKTCGRLKCDFRYSAGIVYNNFPWPQSTDERHLAAVEAADKAVLDSRDAFPDASLADLYDPNAMPPALVKAHRELDGAVDAANLARLPAIMGSRPKLDTEGRRVSFLFTRYARLTALADEAPAAS